MQRHAVTSILALVAVVLPCLLAYNAPPSSTFYNQAIALGAWGAWCFRLAGSNGEGGSARTCPRGLLALIAALLVPALAAGVSSLTTGLPAGLGLGSAATLAAAALASTAGWQAARDGSADEIFSAFCWALTTAGMLSGAIALVQVFAPGWTDGAWVASSGLSGRAVGNLRQPNHLSTLLLLACAAIVWLASARRGEPRRERLWAATLALMIWGVVLTGSRTGGIGVLMLAAWGLLDRNAPRSLRWTLLASPLIYLAWWGLMQWWAQEGGQNFGRAVDGGGDISSSRFGIWANTLALIRMHPWTGVGFGEFNLAWTLTPFPSRPVAFFDHTHNIVLQFIVELGIPLALLVLGLLAWALWGLVERARRGGAGCPATHRAALFMVLLAGVHSMLEYPLWYSYFLLPVVFAWGLALAPAAQAAGSRVPAAPRRLSWLAVGGALLVFGALYAVWDYQRVVAIYAPPKHAAPLSERIARGQHSLFFSHQGDYAAATTAGSPGDAIEAYERAAHNLIDARLLRGWAEAEAQLGHLDRARYLAHRLREFRHPLGDQLFAVCDGSQQSVDEYFQCGPEPTHLTFEDFRRPRPRGAN
jgi:O-antigen ligase